MEDKIGKSLRAILLEFNERGLPEPYFRDLPLPSYHHEVRKAWVLMGMRRSGKTWFAFQHIQSRIRQGHPKESNLYLNFEDDRLLGFRAENFQDVLDKYF